MGSDDFDFDLFVPEKNLMVSFYTIFMRNVNVISMLELEENLKGFSGNDIRAFHTQVSHICISSVN